MVDKVARGLGDRRLVWSGLRGHDVEPIADLPNLHAAFCMIGRYDRRARVASSAFEGLTGVRPDLETYDIDLHPADERVKEFRRAHLQALSVPSALVPYRASQFLSSVWFARRDRCTHLGLFGGIEAAFEHKPWVETSLQALGIETVPWTYIADEEQVSSEGLLADGPVVLRKSRTSGGEGFTVVQDIEHLLAEWPHVAESFVSVAPLLSDALPLNVGATVWRDGVTVQHPSVQLVGIPECVTRPFGYCGNDFGLAAGLDRWIIDELERVTIQVGSWLRGHGYLGSFGADYLLHEGRLLFTEINPRFQGSTPASCRLSIEADESCLLLDHVAAHLGLDAHPVAPLWQQVQDARPLAQVIVHWTGAEGRYLDPSQLVGLVDTDVRVSADVQVPADVVVDPGGVVARLTTRSSVTTTGFDLEPAWQRGIRAWLAEMSNREPPPRTDRP